MQAVRTGGSCRRFMQEVRTGDLVQLAVHCIRQFTSYRQLRFPVSRCQI